MKIYDESLYCQECNCEISVAQSKFCNNYCDDCYKVAFSAEQGIQALDTDVDPLALSDEAYEEWINKVAWVSFLGDDIDPRKQF